MNATTALQALLLGIATGIATGTALALALRRKFKRITRQINMLEEWCSQLRRELGTHGHGTSTAPQPEGSRLVPPDHPMHDQGRHDDPAGVSWTPPENTT